MANRRIDEDNEVILQYKNPLREESHPELMGDFPYKFIDRKFRNDRETGAPWHWHNEFEIFYIEKGTLEYRTSNGSHIFPEATGGLINSNVLHRTKILSDSPFVEQKIHIFSTNLVSSKDGRIYKEYIEPIFKSGKPIFSFDDKMISLVKYTFQLSSDSSGYEIKLRNSLSEVLFACYEMLSTESSHNSAVDIDSKLRGMIAYIEEHLNDKISVKQLSDAVYTSERDCYRKFCKKLGETPLHYIQSVRLEKACQLLIDTELSLTEIADLCGLGDSSYFGAVFKKNMGHTPRMYRKQFLKNVALKQSLIILNKV
ncbi:helix-turn-helix domain-containing protein [Clostridium beijerinckii]|uniref:Helix-turn-helix domain-containing protein n=1 Tax=Clostridium beijerinckii TaxID=1520 RepID=A0AAW3W417_CLOBE|nr:helix-turn-helix domain-containing protein [Clostridium beijerinckii]MBC2456093.1 helix-turn-helix domain-containing protein [Clostridium beijerinckii]MBC2473640.1 helix-turn-helix domain-containing protein [Clostridium beijerinckii]NOV62981.1 AraC-like DNA-binding protein [Clostridium beijerinckii]NOV70057.1 AraC-like DNA-binding protein [Clostridium beijerinckii]NOW31036.1 AraC-like DNA-binding protein [Clostridium beijerinckii]